MNSLFHGRATGRTNKSDWPGLDDAHSKPCVFARFPPLHFYSRWSVQSQAYFANERWCAAVRHTAWTHSSSVSTAFSASQILHAILHIQPLRKTRACTIFYPSGTVWMRRWRAWEGGSAAWVMSLTALAAFVSSRYAAACLWCRCLLYSGETTVPRGAFGRNHTSLTPRIPWCWEHSFLLFVQGNLNGRQVGIMANNWV